MERRARLKQAQVVSGRAGLLITAAAVAYAIFVRYAGRTKPPADRTISSVKTTDPKV